MFPPPLQDDTLQVIHIASLAAALAKLNVKIPIEDFLKVIHDEDEARRVKVAAEATQHRAALSELALQPTMTSAGLEFTTDSKSVPKPTKPADIDPLAKDRRRRLLELTNSPSPMARFQIHSH